MACIQQCTNFPKSWDILDFEVAIRDVTGGNAKVKQGDVLETGRYPVIDQGKSSECGYVNDENLLCKEELPAILFGDHTKIFKYVTRPFVLGADGVKVLSPRVTLDKRFLFHFLNTLVLPDNAGYSRHYKFLKEAKIPVPPLPEQKRIAAILDKADAIRRKRQQAIQLADDFLRAVFLDMFGDPVTNPKEWPLFPVHKLGNVITGSTPPSSKDGMFGTDIPFVTPGDLDSNLKQVGRWLSLDGVKHSRTCRQGSLMACCIGATIGKVAIANRHSAFNQQINVIEWNNSVNDIYGYFLFKMNPAFITEKAIKTTLPILKKSLFEEIVLPIAPIEKQNAFSEKVLVIWKFQNTNTKALSYPLFESLSQQAFSGQL